MANFGRKKKFTDYLYTKPVILVLFLIFIFLTISVYERYTIEREMSHRRSEIEAEQKALTVRKDEIQKKVDYLQAERGIEEELRKKFDVAKEGEQVVILLGETYQETPPEEEPKEVKKWYQFWR